MEKKASFGLPKRGCGGVSRTRWGMGEEERRSHYGGRPSAPMGKVSVVQMLS